METPNPLRHVVPERALTVAILRGEHPVDARLPGVRDLAARFQVTPATIQRALARLEMTGLVEVRQGSGIRVLDPVEHGGLSLVPAWLEAHADAPPRSTAILEDFLEVRRLVAVRLLVRHRAALLTKLPELVVAAEAWRAAGSDLDALREADLGFARALLRATGNTVALAVLNTAAEVVTTVPHVAEAMYADPTANLGSLTRVLEALGSADGDALGGRIESALAEVDEGTVRRFRARLEEG